MINTAKLIHIIKEYRNDFNKKDPKTNLTHWEEEQYKWIAVKHFQENWDIDAEDFVSMFKEATSKHYNLLSAMNYFPREMIIKLAECDQEAVRLMFKNLFNETLSVVDRVNAFISESEKLRAVYGADKWKSHYQNVNSISTYLWSRYPDKYYIYKYSEVKAVAAELESDFKVKMGAKAEILNEFISFYDEISNFLQNDKETKAILNAGLTPECYADPKCKTLTIDLGFYISRKYAQKDTSIDDGYWPLIKDYNPGLNKDDWKRFILEVELPDHKGCMAMLKGMLELGGEATCKKLADVYGGHPMKYIGSAVNMGKRAEKFFNVKSFKDNGENYFSLPFRGRDVVEDGKTFYSYKIRDELYEALNEIDLSDIDPYEQKNAGSDSQIIIWKISHGTDETGIPEEYKKKLEERKAICMHSSTQSLAKVKLTQGEDFIFNMKSGDYFYLCYGNSVKLFGQITSDELEENPELGDGWLERPYKIISEAVSDEKYTGPSRWWAPNSNTTFVKVDDNNQFEKLILKPYFNMEIKDLENKSDTIKYWWLNANPKIWSFSDLAVGGSQSYELYNENGNKRRIFQNFLDAREGDLIIGYESTPVKQIVALAKVSKEQDGQKISFEKVEGLENPIDYSYIKEFKELQSMEYFTNPQGSLFKLTEDEYNFILDIIRESNPVPQIKEKEKYTKEDFLSEVFMTEERYDRLVALLDNKKNIILQGAPGVGKTFAAKRLAYSIMGEKDDDKVEFVQFHQNYSYEDFVMGYKPVGDGFELKNGIFYRFCQKAYNNPQEKYFFLIDEINRGNMSKIFGELLMLIEKDYRGTKVTLAYNGMPFSVPPNLYIIGMMNTADRSLAMIDYALRRRFSFVNMEPGFNTEGFKKYQADLNNDTFDKLVSEVIKLNKAISDDKSLGPGFCIGHSYFCGHKPGEDSDWIKGIVEYDIIPMLAEYWFDDADNVKKWEDILNGVING